MRRSKSIRKSPHKNEPVFGAARECKSNTVASFIYTVCGRDYDSNAHTNKILSLLAEWHEESFIDAPLTLHTRESCSLKSQIHDSNTPTYMNSISGKHVDEYYKSIFD